NASNPIFRDKVTNRGVLYEPHSKNVFRISRNFTQDTNIMAIIEAQPTVNGNEESIQERATFSPQVLLKAEHTNGLDYIGLVVTGKEGEKGTWGEYGSYTIAEGWSAYFDASH